MGTDAAKVRLHQRVREQGSVDIGHAAPGEDDCDLPLQQIRFDTSLTFRSGVSRHRLLLGPYSRARMMQEGGGLRVGCPDPCLCSFAI
ncbi:MAG: hypothetical protein OXC01_16170 [Immundisolibacterales bacterium]|nr:hypothetical protein [Immundisolibacterales bacterium]